MNYAVAILAGILIFAMLYWFLGGARKHYIGPRTKYHQNKENDNIIECCFSIVGEGSDNKILTRCYICARHSYHINFTFLRSAIDIPKTICGKLL